MSASSGSGPVNARILVGSIFNCPPAKILPRKVTDEEWNSNFSALMYRWFSNSHCRTSGTCTLCSFGVLEKSQNVVKVDKHKNI